MKLTHFDCVNAKPDPKKNYKLRDGRGLYLFVMKTGGKSWRYDYKVKRADDTHKNGTCVFGSFPDIGLAQARELHGEARKLVSQGIDPHEHKKAQERLDRQSRAYTFADVAQEWLAKREQEVKPKTFADINKRLNWSTPILESMLKVNPLTVWRHE